MTRLIGTNALATRLTDTQVQGGSKGAADIPTSLAGRSRWLHEFATGEVATGNTPCAPNTGMGGGVGHDHSGSVSVPLLHTIALWTFGYGPAAITDVINGVAPAVAVTAGDTTEVLFRGHLAAVLVPMCSEDGAYNYVDLGVQVKTDAACSLNVTVESAGQTVEFSGAVSTSGVRHILSSASSKKIPVKAGHYNRIKVTVEAERSAADATVSLIGIALHQVRTTTRLPLP